MIKLGLILSTTLLTISAFAASLTATTTMAPPEPVDGKTTIGDALEAWHTGAALTAASAQGNWITTSMYTSEACSEIGGFSNSSDPTGLKNDDGTNYLALNFDWKTIDSVPGKRSEKKFVVNIYNLGAQEFDQGPYHVNFAEPNFSTWAYPAGIAWFEYSCHTIDAQNMICLVGMKANRTPTNAVVQRCVSEPVGAAIIYTKAQ